MTTGDALPTLSSSLPVPPGQSPFHARGFVYRRLMEHVHQGPHGKKILDRLDADVRAFVTQKFDLTGWYDVFPTMPVAILSAELEGKPFAERCFERGRVAAVQMIPKLFRALLSMTTPQTVAQRISTLLPQQYDFMMVSNLRTGAGNTSATIAGVPAYVAPYVLNVNAGFVAGAIELARASTVEVRTANVRRSDDVKGFPAVSADILIAWS